MTCAWRKNDESRTRIVALVVAAKAPYYNYADVTSIKTKHRVPGLPKVVLCFFFESDKLSSLDKFLCQVKVLLQII